MRFLTDSVVKASNEIEIYVHKHNTTATIQNARLQTEMMVKYLTFIEVTQNNYS